ncbi:MAG: proline--tRNA ligase [Nitrospirae bacterium]|nr:proline--tRNA ligase [Nitrospirota bacterium]
MNTQPGGVWRYSSLLIPTLREEPGEAEIVSHQLMLRAGMLRKLAAGIYTLLPLGLRVLNKVERVVREEMNRAGAQEILMPMVQPAELWQETGRWQQYGKELLRFKDRHDRDFCLGPTHEEVVTDLVRREVRSYRQLPVTLYQIQMKFRDEIRPRFGVMRGREFLMKDAYSFDLDEAGARVSYQKMNDAYHRIFERCGLKFKPVEADSGVIGGAYSQEFMVLAETGEDSIKACSQCSYAANVEKQPGAACPRCQAPLETHRGIEVGHIFMLGTKYSEAMKAAVLDPQGHEQPMVMGCYGIGVSRTVAAAIEQHHDDKGIRWPAPLAPFHLHVVVLNPKDTPRAAALGYDVVLDDRDDRAGIKFNDADLIGVPAQVIIGGRTLKEGLVELKRRSDGVVRKIEPGGIGGVLAEWLGMPAV